jgi:hypothetical protein
VGFGNWKFVNLHVLVVASKLKALQYPESFSQKLAQCTLLRTLVFTIVVESFIGMFTCLYNFASDEEK